MADFTSVEAAIESSAASSFCGAIDDNFEDACSICLESFTTQDPATVTNCKHEYHLQCIVEWSQRSKECPICWQFLTLKDPASQELLDVVENERNLRSSHISVTHEEYESEHDVQYTDDSDFNERIMQHLAAAVRRARSISRRERQRSSGFDPSQSLIFGPLNTHELQQTHTLPEDFPNSGYGSSEGSPPSHSPSSISSQSPPDVISAVNLISSTTGNQEDTFKHRVFFNQPPPDSPQRPSPSELLSIPESIKSRWSATSARYKESISKSTRGLKEKLLARNNSVKELSKGVQREMSAGIAGFARMIERLDPMSRRSSASAPVSSCNVGTSNISHKGKGVQESVIAQSCDGNDGSISPADVSSHVCGNIPGRLEVSHVQREQ